MSDKKGYYAILHLSRTASEKEIKDAFRREVKLYHPDKNPDPKAKEIYLKLNEAYQVLTDPDARKAYDNVPEASAEFIPCCRCGKHARQPRYIFFEENGTMHGGVFCRDCASKQQFRSAAKIWKQFFSAPVQSWSSLKNNYSFKHMPPEENFSVLMQNAAAFRKEKRVDLARSLAEQARKFAKEQTQRVKINIFLNALPEVPRRKEPDFWEIRWTDTLRVYLPLFLCLIVGLVMLTTPYLHELIRPQHQASRISDYKPQNVVPLKFDLLDETQLYHTVAPQTSAYQAPYTDSGIISSLPEQTTLRITGYVPKTDWLQAMTPYGMVVFVRGKELKKGIGKAPMPYNSKILLPKD